MSFNFLGPGPTHQVKTDHFLSPFRRLAARPQCDHQAGNDRTIGLNFDPILIVAQEMAATQKVLELPEENLDGPSVSV